MRSHDPAALLSAFPITIDQHFTPQFYAELVNVSADTICRWFQDLPGVLKLGRIGKSKRVELRIPLSLFLSVYRERCK